ncbi:MAG TPA: heme o synthase [Gemmatimonadales bacterium]
MTGAAEPAVGGAAPADDAAVPAVRRAARIGQYLQLTKPRLTTLVVVTTLVGFIEGRRGSALDVPLLLQTIAGTFLVAAAAAALNQWAERDVDAAMRRTARRPLPAGTLTPGQALVFGFVLLAIGSGWLALAANPLAAALAAITAACYLLAYTPLKQVTSLATVVGAVPGAIPPMIGWAAARGRLDAGAWILFGIVFFWQMPHFLAISTLYRQDYASAGVRVLSVVDPGGESTGRQSVLYAAALVPVSLLPAFIGLGGARYFAGALVLSILYLGYSIRLLLVPDDVRRARRLFRLSLLYLPLLLLLLVTS